MVLAAAAAAAATVVGIAIVQALEVRHWNGTDTNTRLDGMQEREGSKERERRRGDAVDVCLWYAATWPDGFYKVKKKENKSRKKQEKGEKKREGTFSLCVSPSTVFSMVLTCRRTSMVPAHLYLFSRFLPQFLHTGARNRVTADKGCR